MTGMPERNHFPHAVAYLGDIRAKLVHAAESGEWSARIIPEEAALLLRVLDEYEEARRNDD